ncbi:MAG: tRNA 4-thiouridine(8) synthase ThiI [Anaerolineales bacterium]|nr:tRNA 4-thiouridine(8) synthase ThiI [Anaerolineales bacterium]
MSLIVIRYGEIGLKGKNRGYFVKRLRRNIRDCLKRNDITGEVRSVGQRVYMQVEDAEPALRQPFDNLRMTAQDKAVEKLRDVFGIVSLSPAQEVPADIEAITAEALRVAHGAGLDEKRTFRMQSRRADKAFPLTSPEINRLVGGHVHEATGARVDLSDEADLTIGVEVRREHALVYGQTVAGHGGLPLGTQGRAVALISGGIDSPVAAWMIMKRGCVVIPVHFRQSEVELAKFMDNCEVLSRFAYGWNMRPIVLSHQEVFGETYEKLRSVGAGRWACIFCKRALLQKASQIADEHRAKALITGDSLGQVASQTLDNLEALSYGVKKPILRPLIGLDKTDIIALARRIGTFEISIREAGSCPYVPPDPLTKASLPKLKAILEKMGD